MNVKNQMKTTLNENKKLRKIVAALDQEKNQLEDNIE
jgi:hypothetical protein